MEPQALKLVEMRTPTGWLKVQFSDISKGMIFRMFESDGTPVRNLQGNTELVALENSYFDYSSKTWKIEFR